MKIANKLDLILTTIDIISVFVTMVADDLHLGLVIYMGVKHLDVKDTSNDSKKFQLES